VGGKEGRIRQCAGRKKKRENKRRRLTSMTDNALAGNNKIVANAVAVSESWWTGGP